ncbi:mannosyl-oligosaccharide glucosidase GCS1-like isoform X2 [Zingiber officinale]|uniref:mannosyl-oligosaccharide glucosidase GCS1-like isoform X2 n=1 Tax=Zingiber officinale TaxID=94328 RepID=UPI001C4D285E|nr:mannosyl-oligosaccharide glucosidase GCS1-like isoform X2 [Zingiber officinale]
MSGGSRRTARNRGRPPTIDASDGKSHRDSRPVDAVRKVRSRDHGPIRLMDVSLKTLLWLGFGFLAFISVFLLIYNHHWESWHESPALMRLRRVVTPLQASKMMDLAQFQGEHKESLYWGTYRPHVYFGIRARTPQSLIAGLMWISMRNGQYFLRHVCQDSDDLSTYGWKDHNGRSYGRQLIVDHGLSFTTSFLKEKKEGSGFGGDWAVRLDLQNAKSIVHEGNEETTHLFFYIADEEGNSLNVKKQLFETRDATLLAFGTRNDIGGWELHLDSQRHVDTHFSGFRTHHMHNLTELVQGTLAFQARRTGELQLSDTIEESSNVVVIQISTVLPAKLDIAFVSGTNMKGSLVDQRLHSLTGEILSTRLDEKQKEFEDKYLRYFKLKDKVDSELMAVGRAALGNLLGGIGYFYGQSKIALPEGYTQKNGDKFIYYWPAALFTAVPSRSFFPRGFLWDEGFHQMIIGRWDADLSMDIIGHWLDLINADGWIPREQILGAEALSKVPEEFVLQYSTNGNPPTLFLVIRDLLNGIRSSKFSPQETDEITDFLKRAYVRLNAWFQWFNSTQSGNDVNTFYWHGRDNATTKELNPKTLTSGLDDYPRASHPTDEERHLDLRCWMLLSADCMHSIAELLKMENDVTEDYHTMVKQLSDFEKLNQMHLDDVSGAYYDFGYHTEKVRLRWHERNQGTVQKELIRETLEKPQLKLVPHLGYVSLFPFMMGIIPPESPVLEKQLRLISNRSTLWTEYGLRSLSRTSSLYMKRNTEHDPPYWRGPIWINMNYMILSALHHYSQDGPYKVTAGTLYQDLRSNLISNIARNYHKTGFLWEQYDQQTGKGKGQRPFTGWTSLVILMMSESYPSLQRRNS